jgi:hypothetical protein
MYDWITKSLPYYVSEGKIMQVKLREDDKSKESNANMALTVAGHTAGIIVLAFIIFGIVRSQKRGMFHLAHKWSEMLE